jgi:hypothetical protein
MNKTDTPLSEIEYGKTIRPIVGGKVTTRFFTIKFCGNPECGKQLTVRAYAKGPRAGQLYSTQDHNKRIVCDDKCQAVSNRYRFRGKKSNRAPTMNANQAMASFLYAGAI